MEIQYRDSKIEKICIIMKEAKKRHGDLAEKIHLRIKQLLAVANLEEAIAIRSMRLHPLKGDREGEYSVSLNGNYRMIFTAVKKHGKLSEIKIITIEEIVDYH
ncbi:MAG: type II toxin-antitoxin system RelE/ParE family toxin [Fusobacteriaceae bacterium]